MFSIVINKYIYVYNNNNLFIFNPHPRICLLILEREEVGERERETLMWERNIDWLPLVRSSNRDQTHNLCVCTDWKSKLQPFGV